MPKKTPQSPPPTAPDRPLREPTAPLTSGGSYDETGAPREPAMQPHRGNTVETGGLPEPEE